MQKAKTSFAAKRNALAGRVARRVGAEGLQKAVPFQNQDVPKFLAELDKFERRARDRELVVKLSGAGSCGRRSQGLDRSKPLG